MRRRNSATTGFDLSDALTAEHERHQDALAGIHAEASERQSVVRQRIAQLEQENAVLLTVLSASE
jgi:hypothetical protein